MGINILCGKIGEINAESLSKQKTIVIMFSKLHAREHSGMPLFEGLIFISF